jgi:ubiquinone/menaquinone biosynthesis C-methylase UbiE
MERGNWKKKRDVIRHYNEIANAYNLLYGNEQNLKIELALDAVQVKSSDLVLDVGCGPSFLLDRLDAADLLVGVDISMRLLKLAAKRLKRLEKRPSTALICSDADYLPFKGEVFDKVFALTILQNMPDSKATLCEITRVAKKGSTVVVTGLKKSFSEEGFKSIVRKAGLEFFLVKVAKQAQDIIAVCRRGDKAKNK